MSMDYQWCDSGKTETKVFFFFFSISWTGGFPTVQTVCEGQGGFSKDLNLYSASLPHGQIQISLVLSDLRCLRRQYTSWQANSAVLEELEGGRPLFKQWANLLRILDLENIRSRYGNRCWKYPGQAREWNNSNTIPVNNSWSPSIYSSFIIHHLTTLTLSSRGNLKNQIEHQGIFLDFGEETPKVQKISEYLQKISHISHQ